MKAIVDLIRKDPIRLEALACVFQLEFKLSELLA